MSQMLRVSKKQPCPICKKPDWCLIGKSIVLCMRVVSEKSKVMADGSTGYLHSLDSNIRIVPEKRQKTPPLNRPWAEVLEEWRKKYKDIGLDGMAHSLGVSAASLKALGCQLTPKWQTYGFPMRNGSNHIIGVRLRNLDGKKWAWPGSHNGLFIPQSNMDGCLYIVEGPTDTAAAITMGVRAIGRPSCMGGVDLILEYIRVNNIKRVVIVGDVDKDVIRNGKLQPNPGTVGASTLSIHLKVSHCVLLPPTKDMRSFLNQGGDWKTLDYLTSQCLWKNP